MKQPAPDLFGETDETQGDLFGGQPPPQRVWTPDPDKVRRRLERILAEARAAKVMPWEKPQQNLYRKIFPDMAGFLPEEEAAQLCFEFEAELARLEAA